MPPHTWWWWWAGSSKPSSRILLVLSNIETTRTNYLSQIPESIHSTSIWKILEGLVHNLHSKIPPQWHDRSGNLYNMMPWDENASGTRYGKQDQYLGLKLSNISQRSVRNIMGHIVETFKDAPTKSLQSLPYLHTRSWVLRRSTRCSLKQRGDREVMEESSFRNQYKKDGG